MNANSILIIVTQMLYVITQ